MALDVGPRSDHAPPKSAPPRTPYDWGDLILRALVLAPLLGLYGWWVFASLRALWRVFAG